ncbi:E3 ubiquitin-protein ligase TRIM45-like [Saccostrea cucullata]|uniref:E3 ubiquitin-protein ligase TRIM45-like n=1 Tax=Saccostrea cuccullata TaxID=36930 RepID=UPI002ED65B7D
MSDSSDDEEWQLSVASEDVECDVCEYEDVAMQCETCLVNLCRGCVQKHLESKVDEKHSISRFPGFIHQYPACSSHDNKRCELYCKDCDDPICITCITSEKHRGHDLQDVLKTFRDRRRSF